METCYNAIGRYIYGDSWTNIDVFYTLIKIFKPSHEWEQKLYQKRGNRYWRFNGVSWVLTVCERDLVMEVLASKSKTVFTCRRKISCGAPWIDQVLSLTDQPHDSRIRRIMGPAFCNPFPKANMFFPLAEEISEMLIQAQETPNLDEIVGTYIIKGMAKTLFDYEVTPEEMPDFLNHAKNILTEGVSWREFINIYAPNIIRKILPKSPVFNQNSLNFLKEFAIKAQNKRYELLSNLQDENEIPRDLLQLLLEASDASDAREGPRISDDEIIAQFLMVFIAGYDTNSSVIRGALAYLALHTEMQERLFQEVSRVEEENVFRNYRNLPYLQAVVHESLRICPGAVTFERTAAVNHTFDNKSYLKVKKGRVVSIPNYCLNNDPAIYPNPEQFIPDRFLNDELQFEKPPPPANPMPFGVGRRACVGRPLSLALIEVFLIVVIKRFEFRLPRGISPPFGYEEKQGQLKLKNVPVIFTQRERNEPIAEA